MAQLLAFPMGRVWARFAPRRPVFGVPLNPGPFTIKEHVRASHQADCLEFTSSYFKGSCYHNGGSGRTICLRRELFFFAVVHESTPRLLLSIDGDCSRSEGVLQSEFQFHL